MSIRLLKRRWVIFCLLIAKNGYRRAEIIKRAGLFKHMGEHCFYEPHKLPSEPQLVSVGNNVNIASDVAFYNHDVIAYLINGIKNSNYKIPIYRGGGIHRRQCLHWRSERNPL